MSTRTAIRVAIGAWLISLILVGLAYALPFIVGRSAAGVARYQFWREDTLIVPTFATVGMLIATRRRRHSIGWLFTGIGLLGATQFISGQYATASLAIGGDTLPGGAIAAWLSNQTQGLAVSSITFLLLLFPTGHLPSRRWRVVAWVLALTLGHDLIISTIRAGPLANFPSVENPFGVAGIAAVLDVLDLISVVPFLFGLFGAVASVIVRFRHARGLERQQLKWFVFAATVGIGALVAGTALFPTQMSGVLGNLVWAAAPSGLAIAVAVAILRYRLYDIDLVINRTLVYGALTATLAAVYIGTVVLLQQLLSPFTSGSEVAIVASTLAIAALFNPLRRRIQAFIDKRFYRRKYDAAKVLAAFTARLRNETDLDALANDLLAVVDETMQPAHVSLWLRESVTDGTRRQRAND